MAGRRIWIRQLLGRRHQRHVDLVIEPLLHDLEGCRHVEDLLAVQADSHDPAIGKAVAVQAAVHLIHNRRVEIAAAQEVGVQ